MARLSSELVLSLTDHVSGPARGVGRAMDSLRRTTAASASGMERLGVWALASGSALAGAGAAIAAKDSIRAAADFQSQLVEIRKKAGTSAEQTAKLGAEIKALATSGELAVPIEDIASAYERGAAAGIPIDDLKNFAALSVKAADAFGMSAEDVGNFAAKLQTSLGQTNEEIRKTFDLTNSLADAGIADESAIVDYVDRTGASLKSLGLTMPQTLAVGATMLNLGMSSDVAATASDALARKMQLVGTLTGQSRKSFEKVMGPVGRFSKLVEKDANAALLDLLDHMKALKGEDRAAFLKNFIGDEHAGKILRVAEAVGEVRRNMALANDESKWFGSLDASYKLKLGTFWSQWQNVKNALGMLAIDAGDVAMPGMEAALLKAVELVKEVDGGLKKFKAQVDISELAKAKDAIAELAGQIANMMQTGAGGEKGGGIIENAAKRVANLTNMVTGAVLTAQDALQAVGLVEDDGDTPEQRQKHRSMAADNFVATSPPAKWIADKVDGLTRDPVNRNAQADADRARGMDDFLSGSGLASPERSPPATRGGRVRPPGSRGIGSDAAASAQADADRAAQAFEDAGQRITAAFDITASPKVDSSSLDVLIAKTRQARSELNALGAQANNVAASATAVAGRTSRIDYDGLQADTTHKGF